MTKALLDTNIVSTMMRDPRGPVRRQIEERVHGDVAISIVTLAELRFGAEKANSTRLRAAIDALISYLPALPFDAPADLAYARIRAALEIAGRPIGPNDLLIAAHAIALDVVLVTANIREFSRVPGLRVENWLD